MLTDRAFDSVIASHVARRRGSATLDRFDEGRRSFVFRAAMGGERSAQVIILDRIVRAAGASLAESLNYYWPPSNINYEGVGVEVRDFCKELRDQQGSDSQQ